MIKQVMNVFTNEYREETKYFELKEKMAEKIKLKNQSEKIEDKMQRLKNYESKCSIKVGDCA